jgi:uncharacterized membrane protein YcjF (UPF0283 family)
LFVYFFAGFCHRLAAACDFFAVRRFGKEFLVLRTWWKIIRLVTIGIGLLLSFFAVIEIIRAYQTLYDLHPAAGYVLLGVLFCGTVLLVGYVAITLASRPAVLIPPSISDTKNATKHELRRYGRYLTKYINRLSGNAVLSTEDKDKVREGMMELTRALEAGDNKEAFLAAIEKAEEHVTKPILEILNEESNRQIRASVRDVMIGVTVSPYKAADLIIVLYRNLVMVMRIVRIYNSRPRFRQQLQILGDTIKVVATVNYINVGKSLLEGLGSKLPVIGHYTDDIAQGMGAGFMTSVAGHAAKDRCRAFKGWNEQEAKHNLRNKVSFFYADVRDIFWKDILPEISKLVGQVPKEALEKIRFALDRTGNAIVSFVKVPVRTVAAAGKTSKGSSSTGGKVRNTRPGIFRGVKSAVKKSVSYPMQKMRAIKKLFRRGKN